MKNYSAIIGCIVLLFIYDSALSQNKKFSHEIIIDCQQIESAKMTSDGTIYGKVKDIDIVFPFRTFINPEKGAEIILSANGYEDYKLVVTKGIPEYHYRVVFTPEVQNGKTKSKKSREEKIYEKIYEKLTKEEAPKGILKKYTHPVTFVCDQVESAKVSGTRNIYGKWTNFIDITFPYNDRINPEKGGVMLFKAPGYEDFMLVIPPGTNQHEFRIHFTEDPREMAKLNISHSPVHRASNTHYENNDIDNYSNESVSRDNPGESKLEKTIIRWMIDSDPQGARIFWRVISSIPEEVKNTNESYLLTTPYEETRSFNILGLTYENSRDVQIEIKLMKPGFHTQVKRFNVRQAIDQQEISTFFQLVQKEE